jgi:ferredoxin
MSTAAAENGKRVVIEQTEFVFTCRPGQPILDAAHEQGIALPYACRRGICGLCAAELVHGEVMPVDAWPMTNAHCSAGHVLLCRCSPASDTVTLRPSSWERRVVPRRLPPL